MFAGAHHHLAQERVKSAAAVALVHILLGYALVAGLGVQIVAQASDPLKLFQIIEPPPPPVAEPVRPEPSQSAAQGKAAPENLRAKPVPVVAPRPEVKVERPPPIVAAPVAGAGNESRAGASDRPGPGTGAGGIGNGTGAGGNGNGSGTGTGARLIRGRIRHADYPRSAYQDRIGGTVVARLNVGADGRVERCAVSRSSGNSDLDSTTCRLIEQRFRFEPARDPQGRPIASVTGWQQRWWLEGR